MAVTKVSGSCQGRFTNLHPIPPVPWVLVGPQAQAPIDVVLALLLGMRSAPQLQTPHTPTLGVTPRPRVGGIPTGWRSEESLISAKAG